jgi:hypothetical protein
VFEYVIKRVAHSSHVLSSHQGTLDQFALAVNKVLTVHANPLGREDCTIYWHNYRTTCSPTAPIFGEAYYAMRVEPVLNVIKNVLGKSMSAAEIYRVVEDSTWACRGRAKFYDISIGVWPIASTVRDDITNVTTQVPLAEDDLLPGHLKECRCVFFKKQRFDEIIESVENPGNDVNYRNVKIKSTNPDEKEYNFFDAVCQGKWFGYRVLHHCNFAEYCGAKNFVHIGLKTELQWDASIAQESREEGIEPADLYQPQTLCEVYNYEWPDLDKLPVGLLKCPFVFRNAATDKALDGQKPPWVDHYHGPKSTSSHAPEREVDEQTNCAGAPTPQRGPSSSIPLRDITVDMNSPRAPKRKTPFIDDEAEASDEEEVRPNPNPQTTNTHQSFLQEGEETQDMQDFIDDASIPSPEYGVKLCKNVLYEDASGQVTCDSECLPGDDFCRECVLQF